MDSNGSGRRRFLKQAAAVWPQAQRGLAPARNGPREASQPSSKLKIPVMETASPRVRDLGRGARFSIDHITYYTPLQDYAGIITPAGLHFVQ